MSAAIGVFLALGTIALVIARPRNLNEGWAALVGGLTFLLVGLETPTQAVHAIIRDWNVFLFFAGLMVVSSLAEQSGLFDWIATWAGAHTFGSGTVLYVYVVTIASAVTLLLTNDTTALVLTPIVYTTVIGLGLEPLPFMFATTFVANASSLGLPISNPINFLLADSFGQSLPRYVTIMWLPAVASITVTAILLFWLFRADIGHGIENAPATSRPPGSRILVSAALLGILIATYVLASSVGFPLGIVAIAGALAFVSAAVYRGELQPRALTQSISWPIFGFLAGMLVVIRGLENTGAVGAIGRALVQLGDSHVGATIAVSTVGAALGSNIINNLPTAITLDATLHQGLGMTGSGRTAALYSTIVGCDIGPNLTHLGSLSSMIWLLLLRRRGLDVSVLDYVRVGALLTPAALIAASLALYLALS